MHVCVCLSLSAIRALKADAFGPMKSLAIQETLLPRKRFSESASRRPRPMLIRLCKATLTKSLSGVFNEHTVHKL